jgi:small GTP-binding protein
MKSEAQVVAQVQGLNLARVLRDQEKDFVTKIAWSPSGELLAVPTQSGAVEFWSTVGGSLHHYITARGGTWTTSIAWSPDGEYIATGSGDGKTRVWRASNGERQLSASGSTLAMRGNYVAWSPNGRFLATVTIGTTCSVWDTIKWIELQRYALPIMAFAFSPSGFLTLGTKDGSIHSVDVAQPKSSRVLARQPGIRAIAWSPDGRLLAGSSSHGTICLFEAERSRFTELQGHTRAIRSLSFSFDGNVLASKSDDGTVRLWSTSEFRNLAVIDEPWFNARVAGYTNKKYSGVAFHPSAPILATLGRTDRSVRVWNLDLSVLLHGTPTATEVCYTTAKIVLVGDSGVGKTGLGWRLAHRAFKEHSSTHGQQFWTVDRLRAVRSDKTECEAVLWDLAGQPDYRLTHALFLDKVDLALILFDPGNHSDPLKGVEYWLKALRFEDDETCPKILVAARVDRSGPTMTATEIETFCRRNGIHGGFVATSARSGEGIEELLGLMTQQIDWDAMAPTVTTATFKRIKEYVLSLKESATDEILLDPGELESKLHSLDPKWEFSTDEMMTAVQHLANHGYVAVLMGSSDRQSILMSPEILTNLASSFVLEARRNPAGLGALEEYRVLRGDYAFPEIAPLRHKDREILLDATTVLFLEHNICFRERLGSGTFLIFPSLINQKKPASEQTGMAEDVLHTVTGRVENVYAALVVLLGYSNTFTRTNQWQNQAEYEMNPGEICGFKQIAEREGEIDLVHYYGPGAGPHVRSLFQGLFESFLLARDVTVTKYLPVSCPHCGYRPESAETVKRVKQQKTFSFCGECGNKISLPVPLVEKSRISRDTGALALDQQIANQRTAFEAALTHLKGLIRDRSAVHPPTCFVSYAWGVEEHERWVLRFARDLRNADVDVLFDRRDSAEIGARLTDFINRIEKTDFVVVVGTPAYLDKYNSADPTRGTFVAAEMDLINQRLTGPKQSKDSVLPVLLAGDQVTAFPPLLRGRVYADFGAEDRYFISLFDVILTLYHFPFADPAVDKLRQSVAGEDE